MARSYDTSRTSAELVLMTPDPMGVRDVRFVKAEFVDAKDGKQEYLAISFRQEGSGALGTFMQSDVDETRHSKTEIYSDKRGPDAQGRTKFEKACDDQDALLKHVFGAITGVDYNKQPISGVTTFKDYMKAFIATINVEEAKKVKIHWVKLQWYVSAKDGKAKVTWPSYPPIISSELKPRDWNPSAYEIEKRVFYRPTNIPTTPAPDAEEEEIPTGTGNGPAIPYNANEDEPVGDGTELEDDDEELV